MRSNATPLSRPTRLLSLLLLGLVAACSKPSLPGDLQIADVTTGRSITSDGAITEDARTMMFWTNDTFYVSVKTEGSAQNVKLQARWTGPGGTTAEQTKTISPSGTTITAFEAAPPKATDGHWPAGDFKLEILVNDTAQATRDLNTR